MRAAGRTGSVALAIVLAVVLCASLAVAAVLGTAGLPPTAVLDAVLARLTGAASGLDPLDEAIVWQLRLPRILTAAAVGAGLALAGAVMQAVTRNRLADPYLLGLSSGASVGAVGVLLLGVGLLLPVAAFAGALAALALTLVIASAGGRGLEPGRMILAGVAVSAFGSALTSLVIFWTATGDSYREIVSWLLGSLAGARWPAVAIAAGALLVVGVPLLRSARTLDAFAFGDTAAAALGVPVVRTRWLLMVATALLTGAMVSVSGAIGFIGLVVPHAVRLVVGARHRRLLPLAALTVVTNDPAALEPFAGIIGDELNVKQVVLEALEEDSLERFGITRTLRVNARAAGPRIGKQVQAAIKASKSGDWSADGGQVVAGGIALEPHEYELDLAASDPAAAIGFLSSGGFVLLDTATTPELEAEGLARDVIRAVQQARKEADLDVSDRILLSLGSDDEGRMAIERHRDLIAAETLAVDVTIGVAIGGVPVGDGSSVVIGVVKA